MAKGTISMSSPSKTETSSSSLSIDSVHPSPSPSPLGSPAFSESSSRSHRTFHNEPVSPSARESEEKPAHRDALLLPSTSPIPTQPSSSPSESPSQPPTHASMLPTGFASIHIGIGSPKIDFARDWQSSGSNSTLRRETSASSSTRSGPLTVERKMDVREEDRASERRDERERDTRRSFVDKASGLPSPPGTESDIAAPREIQGSALGQESRRLGESIETPNRVPSTTSSSSSHISRRADSFSNPTGGTPELARPIHSHRPGGSMSRSSSSTSIAFNHNKSPESTSLSDRKRAEIFGGSRYSPSSELSRSQSSSTSNKSRQTISPRRRAPPSLDLSPKAKARAKIASPERTAKLPPVSGSARRSARRLSGQGTPSQETLEEEPDSQEQRRRSSQGVILDEKIKEVEDKIIQVSSHRKRRSVDGASAMGSPSKVQTPVKGELRRHDSYSKTSTQTASPVAGSKLGMPVARSGDASRTYVNGESPWRLANGSGAHRDDFEEDERLQSGERSGGSGGRSRKRSGLPNDFKVGSFFTPSPQRQDEPWSARSRLRQSVESPSTYHSPLPSRFSTTSRLSRDFDPISARTESFDQKSTTSGRDDTSSHVRRAWSQSISGLPRMQDSSGLGLDGRGLPSNVDRFRPGTVLDNPADRSRYNNLPRGQSERGADFGTGLRRGTSMLVSERDLIDRSRLTSMVPLAPGDSISAVGARSERGDPSNPVAKDPLDVIRKLEAQRADSRKRWDHMPRSSTSMSSMRDIYQNPPKTAPPVDRRSIEVQNGRQSLSPSYGRGGGSRVGGMPATEPRHQRSYTSLGGRSSATSASMEQRLFASSEHGRLLFEAYRSLEFKLGYQDPSSPTYQHDALTSLKTAARSSEGVNSTLQAAYNLAHQITLDAAVEDNPGKVREGYTALTMLLRDAGKASDQSVRDMTRVMLDIPRLVGSSSGGYGQVPQPATPAGSVRGGLRRSESVAASMAYDYKTPSSDDRARRWTPSAASTNSEIGSHGSPLHHRYSVDSSRRSFDVLRSTTSLRSATSLDTSNPYSSPLSTRSPRSPHVRSGSAVSSLVSKVRNMGLTPKKSVLSPRGTGFGELSTIEQSPPQEYSPQMDTQPFISPDRSHATLSRSESNSPEKPSPKIDTSSQMSDVHQSSSRGSRSPSKSPSKSPSNKYNILRKKASSTSSHTLRGGSFPLPQSSSSRGKPTTAVSQITAGDMSPRKQHAMSIKSSDLHIDEPNSPMSRFSFQSQSRLSHEQYEEGEYAYEDGELSRRNSGGVESDAVSVLEQNLVLAAIERERQKEDQVSYSSNIREEEGKGRRMTDRLRASLRRGSNRYAE
ncbi:hypothetical protein B9479_002759 [Cryptococcus floricola]|uniref:Uncharacterized protein n=1 Tax=Cryptococcus floricola TaxID=2591691 RepID=A0A5D3B064_9TREE|nr:hypothetical protein B9479_002759 [Cryptococcus floricola]